MTRAADRMAVGAAARQGAKDLALAIERDINLGRFAPGAWLKQVDLEQAYDTTRLVVRQALDRLIERGQVELFPNRGYRVRPFDPRRFADLVGVRAVLEVAAVQMVAASFKKDSVARLRAAAEQFAEAVAGGTPTQQEQANRAFHRELLRDCPNREMINLIFDLRDRVPMSVRLEKYTAAMLRESADDHFEMIGLLARQDAAGLAALVRNHALRAAPALTPPASVDE